MRNNFIYAVIACFLISVQLIAQVGKKGETNSPSSGSAAKESKSTNKGASRRPPSGKRNTPSSSRSNTDMGDGNTTSGASNSDAAEIAYWETIKNSNDPEDFKAYLKDYPSGKFVSLARNRINAIEAKKASQTQTPSNNSNESPSNANATPSNALPSLDQVLDRYIQARGGFSALTNVVTLIMKGSQVEQDGSSKRIEYRWKAPNKIAWISDKNERWGFDGINVSFQTIITEPGMYRTIKRDGYSFTLAYAGQLREVLSTMVVKGRDKIDGRDVYFVQATSNLGEAEKLYFDTQTGLLIRRIIERTPPSGTTPLQLDYEDYRMVNNVMMPFTIRTSIFNGSTWWKDKFDQININAAIDDAIFAPPRN